MNSRHPPDESGEHQSRGWCRRGTRKRKRGSNGKTFARMTKPYLAVFGGGLDLTV